MNRAPLLALLLTSPLAAQSPVYPATRGGTGMDLRGLSFGEGIRLRRALQLTVPVSVGVPAGRRLFVDVVGNYARTRLESVDGIAVELNGMTDTQARFAYTFGRDAAVLSVAANFPTGESRVSSDQLPIVRSIAQNFLPFPVTNYGTGFGATGAAAAARRFGGWNVGLAGSVRYLAAYRALADLPGSYSPGVEGRARLGADRLVGERTRVTLAFTFSTFGTDEFTGAGLANFSYRPGKRHIEEFALAHQVGRSTLQISGWVFSRTAGDSGGMAVLQARERVYYGGLSGTVPVGFRLLLSSGLDLRLWRPADGGRGRVVGLRLVTRARMTRKLELASSVSGEVGRIRLVELDKQGEASLRGLGLAVFLRLSPAWVN